MANIIANAIASVVKKATEWIPSRNTSLKDEEDKLKGQIDELITQKSTPATRARLAMLTHKLRECRNKIKNALG